MLNPFAASAQTIPYTMTWHDVSGNCTLYPDFTTPGILTPTSQANTYTTVLRGTTTITLTVPGSNTFTYSYLDGNGVSWTDNVQ